MKFLAPFFRRRAGVLLVVSMAAAGMARAQWVKESYPLVAGWNAIWLSQDCSYDEITNLLSTQPRIVTIWRWNPLGSTIQYVTTPANPIQPDTEWSVWRSGDTTGTTFNRLTGNAAYLVEVSPGAKITLELTGRPMIPSYNGQSTGLSFSGFPILPTASLTQRRFDRFLSFDSVLKNKPRIFRYVGGPISDDVPKNPVEVTQPTNTSVERNVAYWVQPANYTTYYGPIEVSIASGDGLDYGTGSVSRTIRVKNVTDPAKNQTVAVTFAPSASAAPPAGQGAIAGAVPLLLDNGIDEATLTRTYSAFSGPITRSIPPGGEVDVDFILNRGAMGTVAGLKFQSLIQVSDSLSLTRVDVPVSATSTSLAGLWVGDIVVNAVDQILGNPESPSSTPSAAPTPTPSPTPAPAGTSSPFTMRVIVHIDAAGHATLLQQAYAVIDTSLLGVVDPVFKIYTPAKYKDVAATAKSPVRLSSAAFPIDMEVGGTSNVAPGATVPFETIVLPHNAATNPFVHPYHPAHDNYDATFRHALGDGEESYMIKRDLTFAFASGQPGNPAWGSTELSGIYTETLKGLRANAIHVTGVFSLKRVAIAPILVK